jgi:deoxyguanosine kinase
MNFLVIEGNIGAGKTSLATLIGNRFNARTILERFSENPFLPDFYRDPGRFAFPLELSFLADRYNQLKNELINQDLFKSFTIADYYFSKSLIFSGATLSGHEYRLFRQLFDIMNHTVPVPDLYVYLHSKTERLLERIKKRGRPYEQAISAGYLMKIQRSYFDFMKQQKDFRFLAIDVGDADFVDVQDDFETIIRIIFEKKYSKGINRIVL